MRDYPSRLHYGIDIWICEKGKRKWNNAIDSDSYRHRNLSLDDRAKDIYSQMVELVSEQELFPDPNKQSQHEINFYFEQYH